MIRKLHVLLIVFCLLAGIQNTWAQDRSISGTVTSTDDGASLPGVNIVLKGTTNGAVTDGDGKYKISIPSAGGVLVFSFIGFQVQEIEIGQRTTVDVSLAADVTQLSEVVVTTAGGLQSRARELGSAIAIVTPQTLTAGKAVNLAAGLQGKVAGFQINATSSGVNPDYRLVLRGQRSLTGNNEALIVLDNVIVPSGVLSNLNMNDVESVNILNGAGAAALYGSQASNGAMIITTKKGKNGKMEMTLSNNTQIQQVAFLPKIQKNFGSGGSSYGTDPAGIAYFSNIENQSYGPAFDGSLRPLGSPFEDGRQDYTTYNYKPGHSDFWQLGITNQSDFSLSSGDDKSSFYISGQYVKVTGTTPGDEYTRGNVRVNGMRKVSDKVTVTYATTFAPNSYDITTATGNIYNNMLNMPSNVDITKYKNWQKPTDFGNPNNFYNPWYQNPYWSAANNRQKEKNNYLTGNIELKFTPIKGLDIIARQGIAQRSQRQKTFNSKFDYTTYAENTPASSKIDIPASVSELTNFTTQLVSDFIVQYNKSLGDFNLNFVGGTQLIANNAKVMGIGINGLVVEGLYNLSNGTGNPTYGERDFQTHLMGTYGKMTVGFKDYLFITATGRNDWDSRLNANNRSFFYPSTEASFVASEAIPAIKNNRMISYLKVRGSVSKTGLVNLGNSTDYGAYYTLPTFYSNVSYQTPNGFPYGSLAGYSQGNVLVNKNLKPELTHGFEFGFDLNLWNDRIQSNVTYYHTRTNNQTVTTSLSNSTGFSSLLTNVGETQSKGVELSLHVTPVQFNNFSITVGGNMTYLNNTVISISDQLPLLALSNTVNAVSAAVAGKPFPVIMGLDYQRDPQGHVIVDAITGQPSVSSGNVILGNATPKYRIGYDAVVNYKSFRFSVLFEYRGGYSVYNGLGNAMDWSGTPYRTALYDRKSFVFPNSVIQNSDGTYVENKTTTIANGNGNNGFWSDGITRNTTSNYVTSGNFVKLREISLSYDLPSSILSKMGKVLKGVSVSVQGRNLFLWMAKDNFYTDPEYSTAGSTSNGTGLNDVNQTPPTRNFGGTLSLRF